MVHSLGSALGLRKFIETFWSSLRYRSLRRRAESSGFFPERTIFTLVASGQLEVGCPSRMMTGPEHVIHLRSRSSEILGRDAKPAPLACPGHAPDRVRFHVGLRRCSTQARCRSVPERAIRDLQVRANNRRGQYGAAVRGCRYSNAQQQHVDPGTPPAIRGDGRARAPTANSGTNVRITDSAIRSTSAA